MLVLLLFSFTVSAPDLVAALAARGLPPQFGFVLASALTLLPAMAGRLEAIRAAQEARGLVVGGGVVSRLAAVRVQMVPLVLGLIEDSGSRAQALDARGFGSPGPDTSYREVHGPARPAPVPGRRCCVLAAAAVALRLWPPPGRRRGSYDNCTGSTAARLTPGRRRAGRPDRHVHLPRRDRPLRCGTSRSASVPAR